MDQPNNPPKVLDLAEIVPRLQVFLEQNCSSLCLDDEEDRRTCATQLAEWLLDNSPPLELTKEKLLPKGRYRAGFNVVDEATGEHIIAVILYRDQVMTDGDFLQMQNWFWNVIGRAIRDNPDVINTLRAGGIEILIGADPFNPGSYGGEQATI
jgi:hypothetical protein